MYPAREPVLAQLEPIPDIILYAPIRPMTTGASTHSVRTIPIPLPTNSRHLPKAAIQKSAPKFEVGAPVPLSLQPLHHVSSMDIAESGKNTKSPTAGTCPVISEREPTINTNMVDAHMNQCARNLSVLKDPINTRPTWLRKPPPALAPRPAPAVLLPPTPALA